MVGFSSSAPSGMPSLLLNALETFRRKDPRLLCPLKRMLLAKLALLLMPRRGVAGELAGMVRYPLADMSGWRSPEVSSRFCERDIILPRRSE